MSDRPPLQPPARYIGPRTRGCGEAETHERNLWIVDRLREGYTLHEVADAVSIAIRTLMEIRAKLDPRPARTPKPPKPARKHNPLEATRSFIFEFRRGLPDNVQQWLIDECPDGITMGEFVASIVVDAYAEESV